jgi:cysteine-rich repeat protein
MRKKLFLAALAVLAGCDRSHGIGALGSDAGVSISGAAAGGFSVEGGVGGAVGSGGMLQVAGGSGGCGTLCLVPAGGAGGDMASLPNINNCGNGLIDTGEYCDDGNTVSGDGCTGCAIEPGWQCPVPGQFCSPIPVGADGGPGPVEPLGQGPTSWTGYIENYQFPSGSDVIRFTSTVDSSGQVMVTVFLGNGPPPPPATDPNVAYPPVVSGFMPIPSSYWAEGFAYSMTSGTFQPQRLRFAINNLQLWSGWCALQTPRDDSGLCLPPTWGGLIAGGGTNPQCALLNPANGQNTLVDCGKWSLCTEYHVCLCTTTACAYDPNSGTTASFDLAITGPLANGSVVGLISDRANVHFTLDPS